MFAGIVKPVLISWKIMDCEAAALCESDADACNGSHVNSDLTHEQMTSEKLLKSAETECPPSGNCDNIEAEAMKIDAPQTQLSPPAKSSDDDCILVEDSPPVTANDSAKSKRGTGRKGAFAGAGSKRSGPSSKSTSPETNGKPNDGLQRFLNMVSLETPYCLFLVVFVFLS
jgi:hypothetical protein